MMRAAGGRRENVPEGRMRSTAVVLLLFATRMLLWRGVGGTVYEDANAYWPFTNSTRGLATGKDSVVLGDTSAVTYHSENGLQFTTLDVSRAALNLTSFGQTCLEAASNCDGGFSIGVWIKLDVTTLSSVPISVPILTASGSSGSKVDIMKIWHVIGTAGQQLHIVVFDGFWSWEFSKVVFLQSWTHLSVSFSKTIGMSVFVNGEMDLTASIKRAGLVLPTRSYLTVGNLNRVVGTTHLSLSQLAIWNVYLSKPEIDNVYWYSKGLPVETQRCDFSNGSLFYSWKTSRDHYSQSYTYTVRVVTYEMTSELPPLAANAQAQNFTVPDIIQNTQYVFETTSTVTSSPTMQRSQNFSCYSGTNGRKPRLGGEFGLKVLSATKVLLHFNPIPPTSEIVYGTVTYIGGETEAGRLMLATQWRLNHTINGLTPYTFFNFTLSAYTNSRAAQMFAKSALTQRSWDIPATGVSNVRLVDVTWHSIHLSWTPPQDAERYVLSYKITVVTSGNDPLLTLTSITPSANVSRLRQNTMYTIDIKVGSERSGYARGLDRKVQATTEDRDECVEGLSYCSKHASCINTRDSYSCRCNTGYYGDGQTCKRVTADVVLCEPEMARGLPWYSTAPGMTDTGPCPNKTDGSSTRKCTTLENGKVAWGEPDLSGCLSIWLKSFVSNMLISGEDSDVVSNSLSNSVATESEMYGGDVIGIVGIMGSLADQPPSVNVSIGESNNETKLRNFTGDIVSITSTMLEEKNEVAWTDLPTDDRTAQASKVLLAMEELAATNGRSLGNEANSQGKLSIVTDNAVMEVSDVMNLSNHSQSRFPIGNYSDSVVILSDDFEDGGKHRIAAYISYKNMGELLDPQSLRSSKEEMHKIVSNVMSFSLIPESTETFKTPVTIIHKYSNKDNLTEPMCVFWKETLPSSGYWSGAGCYVNQTNATHMTCKCYHLTNFAILMSVTEAGETMAAGHVFALRLISVICIGISLVALFLAFITFWYFRQLKSSRTLLHKNLIVALFVAELLFITGVDRVAIGHGCNVIGILLHYFFLVAFMLMGLEGVVLYMMLFQVYKTVKRGGYANWKYISVCWLVPVAIVGSTVAVDWTKYRTSTYCWISSKDGFMWSFVGPVLTVILVNTVFFMLAIRMMIKKSRKRDNKSSEVWRWMKGSSILLSVLGLTWIIGLFYINSETVAVAYLFSILNSLQGLGIFVFHCLADPRIRHAYRNLFCCRDKSAAYYSSSFFSKNTKCQNGKAMSTYNPRSARSDTVTTREDAGSITNMDRVVGRAEVPTEAMEAEIHFKTDGDMSDSEDGPNILQGTPVVYTNGL